MEMFVETVADSFADSHFLRVLFFFFMEHAPGTAEEFGRGSEYARMEFGCALCPGLRYGYSRMFSCSRGRYSMGFVDVPDAGLIRDNPGPILKEPGAWDQRAYVHFFSSENQNAIRKGDRQASS